MGLDKSQLDLASSPCIISLHSILAKYLALHAILDAINTRKDCRKASIIICWILDIQIDSLSTIIDIINC